MVIANAQRTGVGIQLAIRGLHPRAASALVSLAPCRMPLVLLKHGKLPDHPERSDWPARVGCWVIFELVDFFGGRREPQPKQQTIAMAT